MEIKRICQIYFSPTGTTEKVVQAVSAALVDDLDVKSFIYDFTTAAKPAPPSRSLRRPTLCCSAVRPMQDGCRTLLLKYLDTIDGSGAIAVPIVTFGQPRLRQFPHRAARYP